MSNQSGDALRQRIMQSLSKLGFVDCTISSIRDECVTLRYQSADRNDHCLIQVALRLMPGVSSVVFEPTL
jgi:hypothetical protein